MTPWHSLEKQFLVFFTEFSSQIIPWKWCQSGTLFQSTHVLFSYSLQICNGIWYNILQKKNKKQAQNPQMAKIRLIRNYCHGNLQIKVPHSLLQADIISATLLTRSFLPNPRTKKFIVAKRIVFPLWNLEAEDYAQNADFSKFWPVSFRSSPNLIIIGLERRLVLSQL